MKTSDVDCCSRADLGPSPDFTHLPHLSALGFETQTHLELHEADSKGFSHVLVYSHAQFPAGLWTLMVNM